MAAVIYVLNVALCLMACCVVHSQGAFHPEAKRRLAGAGLVSIACALSMWELGAFRGFIITLAVVSTAGMLFTVWLANWSVKKP